MKKDAAGKFVACNDRRPPAAVEQHGDVGSRRVRSLIRGGAARMNVAMMLVWAVLLSGASAEAFDPDAGRQVYDVHCANCHGQDGMPTMTGTPDFTKGETLNTTDVTLARSIKAGRNLMPSYDGILNDAELLNVVAYLRTLQR